MHTRPRLRLVLALVLGASLPSLVRAADEGAKGAERDIRKVMALQAKAWNEGDIPAYMAHYWKSESLTFSAGGKTTRGWRATLKRYQDRYPTPEDMGKLTFSKLEFQSLGADAALVLGRWRLDKEKAAGGNFSVVFRKIDGRWVIIHDHSSSDPAIGQ